MADLFFTNGKKKIIDHNDADTINLLSDTIQAMLVSSAYVGAAGDGFVSFGAGDPAGSEISVAGYTSGFAGTGRKTLGGKTITVDNVNQRAVFQANNVVWTALGAGATIGAVIIYARRGSDALSPLIAKMSITPQATNGTDVTAQWNTNGILTF